MNLGDLIVLSMIITLGILEASRGLWIAVVFLAFIGLEYLKKMTGRDER